MSATASAIITAFTAGLASFFAPCAFPLLPGYVGYYASTVDGEVSLSGVVVRGVAGSIGVVLAFGAIIGIIAAFGRSIVGSIARLQPIIGAVLVVLGFLLLFQRYPRFDVRLPKRRSSITGFVLFGIGYAIAATSCFAPIFFAVVLGSTTVALEQTLLTIGAFAGGLAAPLALTTIGAGLGYDVGSSVAPRLAGVLTRWAGVIIVIAGVWQITRTVPIPV